MCIVIDNFINEGIVLWCSGMSRLLSDGLSVYLTFPLYTPIIHSYKAVCMNGCCNLAVVVPLPQPSYPSDKRASLLTIRQIELEGNPLPPLDDVLANRNGTRCSHAWPSVSWRPHPDGFYLGFFKEHLNGTGPRHCLHGEVLLYFIFCWDRKFCKVTPSSPRAVRGSPNFFLKHRRKKFQIKGGWRNNSCFIYPSTLNQKVFRSWARLPVNHISCGEEKKTLGSAHYVAVGQPLLTPIRIFPRIHRERLFVDVGQKRFSCSTRKLFRFGWKCSTCRSKVTPMQTYYSSTPAI